MDVSTSCSINKRNHRDCVSGLAHGDQLQPDLGAKDEQNEVQLSQQLPDSVQGRRREKAGTHTDHGLEVCSLGLLGEGHNAPRVIDLHESEIAGTAADAQREDKAQGHFKKKGNEGWSGSKARLPPLPGLCMQYDHMAFCLSRPGGVEPRVMQ